MMLDGEKNTHNVHTTTITVKEERGLSSTDRDRVRLLSDLLIDTYHNIIATIHSLSAISIVAVNIEKGKRYSS